VKPATNRFSYGAAIIFRWEENMKMDLRGIGWCGMGWINLAQDRGQWKALVNTVMNLRVA
jgi:hypothetical protein